MAFPFGEEGTGPRTRTIACRDFLMRDGGNEQSSRLAPNMLHGYPLTLQAAITESMARERIYL